MRSYITRLFLLGELKLTAKFDCRLQNLKQLINGSRGTASCMHRVDLTVTKLVQHYCKLCRDEKKCGVNDIVILDTYLIH